MSRRTPEKFEIDIEKIVFGGEGLGFFDKKPVFIFGVLPGEKVLVRPVRVRGKFIKAAVVEILKPSACRRSPQNNHFLTSSPWEIFPENQQRQIKVEITKNMWLKLTKKLPVENLDIDSSINNWNYRNKLEFSFTKVGDDISLAFHQRYYYNRFYALERSELAPVGVNTCAQAIMKKINNLKIPIGLLKNLLIRYSFFEDKCIAVLYVTKKSFSKFDIKHPKLVGWQIVYSDPKSPAAITSEVLYKQGDVFLKEKIAGKIFTYGYDNFFQVNPQTFEKIIAFIKSYLSNNSILLDLYSGVGVIGMSLAGYFKKVVSVEHDLNACEYAWKNTEINELSNIEIIDGLAENQSLAKFLSPADCLIVDPPRSGLHPQVVREIITSPPGKFIYVSCNPATQARDWQQLSSVYKTVAWRLFDMYPQTPHIESVLIMEKI